MIMKVVSVYCRKYAKASRKHYYPTEISKPNIWFGACVCVYFSITFCAVLFVEEILVLLILTMNISSEVIIVHNSISSFWKKTKL